MMRVNYHFNRGERRGKDGVIGLLLLLGLISLVTAACTADRLPSSSTLQAMGDTPPAAVTAPPEVAAILDQAPSITQPTQTATTAPTQTVSPTASLTPIPSPTATETLIATETSTATVTAAIAVLDDEPTKPPPLPTPSGIYSWTLRVPILMYHYISDPPAGADKYRRDLSVSAADFAEQMAYLTENGFETIDLYDLSLAITSKRELPAKPVIITLDDGYRDNYENAFPILQANGQKATFFVVTQFIDEGREEYMSWDMIEEMAASGMRIEPHSKTHPDLRGQERDYVIYEALGSQETIAAHIGYQPRFFCYPGGRYDDQTMAILDELGYWGAVTTADGRWHGFDNRFEWARIRMRNTTVLPEFADMVDPADTVSGKPPP